MHKLYRDVFMSSSITRLLHIILRHQKPLFYVRLQFKIGFLTDFIAMLLRLYTYIIVDF